MPDAAVATKAVTGGARRVAPAMTAARSAILRDIVCYGLCSAASLVLDWGLLIGLVHAGLSAQLAAATGFVAGMALNYALSVALVFNDRRRDPPLKEAAIFAAIGIAGLCLNQTAIFVLSSRIGLDPALAKAPTAVLVFLFNFGLRRSLLFSQQAALQRCAR